MTGGSLNIDELAVWCSKFVDVAVNQISQMRLTGRQMKFHAVGNSMGCQVLPISNDKITLIFFLYRLQSH